MKKRIMGIETEYGSMLRLKNGKFSKEDSSDYFFRELDREFDKSLKPLKICRTGSEDTPEFWLGRIGGKFYDDSGHIEYSSPECSGAREVALYGSVGDMMLAQVAAILRVHRMFNLKSSRFGNLFLTKNNSDFVRTTSPGRINLYGDRSVNFYGSHENYLILGKYFGGPMAEEELFVRKFAPFLASRAIIHGSGGFWWTPVKHWHYVLSPRAGIIEQLSGNLSRSARPLVQVRGSYGLSRMERLHLICADSNMSEWSTFLKFGATHLILRVMEEIRKKVVWPELDNAVLALQDFSSDLSLKHKVGVGGGKYFTAIELQKFYLNLVLRLRLSEEEKEIVRYWTEILRKLEDGWENVSQELDWAIKLSFLRRSMRKKAYDFQDERARVIDVLYSDISDQGIFNRLKKSGAVNPFYSEEEIRRACISPPPRTRARLRSKYILAFLDSVPETHEANSYFDVSWDVLHFSPEFNLSDPFKFQSRKLDIFLEKISKNSQT